MSLENIADKVVETDVLVIGGGLAGCCAAIKAREHNLNVTVLEKAATERSGSAAQGIDHFGPFPRDGITALDLTKLGPGVFTPDTAGEQGLFNENVFYRIVTNVYWALEELEKIGVPMKWDDGEYYWMAPPLQGVPKIMIRAHKTFLKPELARAVRKSGANVLDRTMVVDLLTNNGSVVGATGLNIRTGEFIVCKAKATVIATGSCARLYDPETPLPGKYKMKYHWCPSASSGDGEAMAYRAGASLVNMELTTWLMRIRDDLTISYGNLPLGDGVPCKVYTADGEEIKEGSRLGKSQYLELERQGKTPIYNCAENLPDDYHKRMEVAYADERPISFKMAEDRGFNPRKQWYEITGPKPLGLAKCYSGVYADEDFRTSLEGLYVIGDTIAGVHNAMYAVTMGMWLGDNVHTFIKEVNAVVIDEKQVQSQKEIALAPLSVKDGEEPLEFELAIRHINERYVGTWRSGGKLREGLNRLASLRRVWLAKLAARNPHELMLCMDVRNILDLSEVHIKAALERKETRAEAFRLDYPEKDSAYEGKVLFAKLSDGEATLTWGEIPRLKAEYEKGGK